MSNIHVKTGETVIVNSGKYKGVTGEVVAVSPKEGKVIVKGVHTVAKHVKPRRQGEAGGIVKTEGAIYACKVSPYCKECKKGTRVSIKVEGDKKIRCCAKCGKAL